MGRAKDLLIEEEERGWRSVPDRYVCPECFEDENLKQVILENAVAPACDYCGLTAPDLTGEDDASIAAPVDSVLEVIAAGLYSEWNDADSEGITYESAEGGYQARTLSTFDLVVDYVCPSNDELIAEIISALPDHAWVERHYYSLSEDEALWYGWEKFCELVKHKNRYMFHLPVDGRSANDPIATESVGEGINAVPFPFSSEETGTHEEVCPPGSAVQVSGGRFAVDLNDRDFPDPRQELIDNSEGILATRILDAIGEAVEEVGLTRILPSSTKFYRGRVGPADKPYRTARKLGPPPQMKALDSRMSPAGIPMFYGAMEEFTAIAETVVQKISPGTVINVGQFTTLVEFWILDLTKLDPVPSLFSEQRHMRPVLKFLNSFVRDLSKPIKRDGRVHIEYVPTQIVTEYFRHSFKRYDGSPVRGILYPSSRAPGGIACVLFFTREECGAPQSGRYREHLKQWLRFVRGSAKPYLHKPRRPKVT